jgi:hypothetical protein
MKKIAIIVVALFFVVPSVSFAAALTTQQSASLIAVVQSSPGTPASAFVSLITAFSNITVNQATSLISVVQAAPGVAANAFVNLLTSFTVDTVAIQPITPAVTPTTITPPTQTSQQTTQTVTPTVIPSTNNNTTLVITVGQINTIPNSTHIEWDTNLPTDSKIFIVHSGTTVQVVQSAAGESTHHFVDISNLAAGTQYSYTIEAIAGTQDQKINGLFTTMDQSAITVLVNPPRYINSENASTTVYQVSVLDKDGNSISQALISTDYPMQPQYANGTWAKEGVWYTVFSIPSYIKSVTFTSGNLTNTVTTP